MSDNLEILAQKAHAITKQRFGNTIKLYAPVYISNSCINGCLYCGFNSKNKFARRTLSAAEVITEAKAIMAKGHKHLLLVAGEDPENITVELLEEIAHSLKSDVASLTVEVQPLNENGYKRLVEAGIDGVTLYQETYDENTYKKMHPYGPKSLFSSRMDAIDAAGSAGMRFLGIGALLGLYDWRFETESLISHAKKLMKEFWQASVTISIPRIRDSESHFKMPSPVSDRELVEMICTLRLALPDCGIVLSTREKASLRDKLIPLGITQISAGSVTSPGGYTHEIKSGDQFHIEDSRTPNEVAEALKKMGYDPVWKDWDPNL